MELSYTQKRWSLADLYPSHDGAEMKAALDELETRVAAFEGHREQLSTQIPVSQFMRVVQELEAINHLLQRVYGFAGLKFYADTQDQVAQTFLAQVEQLYADLQNRVLFFSLWWKNLDDEPAQRLMVEAGDYRYWLEEMRHFKPHTLTEPEEKIINIKNVTGAAALNTLYDSITNRYTFKIEVDGDVKELTRDELMIYVRQADADLRARAYRALYEVYGKEAPILGQIYQTLVRDWRNEQINLRHFANPIAARNLRNDIPNQVIDTLLEVCEQNAALFQRFFRLKARWLGVDRLRRYDIYAPVTKSEKTYAYGEAVGMVLDSFHRFDTRIANLARQVFENEHIDSEVRKGKRGGAFCWSVVPRLTPWVLVNYQGRAEDAAALAHELGHAIHASLAGHHTLFTYHSSLPLAETASTFGEMLLVDRLLVEENDDQVRRDLLFKRMDDSYATIMRQAYFAIFERQAHEQVKQGASVDDLSVAYLENLNQQFGDALEISDEFRWEWVAIPHIYETPFYVYAYAFGQLLVLALYQQYKAEGERFKPRYLQILSAGGSDAPARILANAGIDIFLREFWQGGFDVLESMLAQLETIPVSRSE